MISEGEKLIVESLTWRQRWGEDCEAMVLAGRVTWLAGVCVGPQLGGLADFGRSRERFGNGALLWGLGRAWKGGVVGMRAAI